jgi:hypothetical protein
MRRPARYPSATLYDKTLGLLPDYAGQAAFVSRLIGRHFRGPVSVLDVGCGTGQLLERLEASLTAHSLTGVDQSSGMLKAARARGLSSTRLVQADAEYFLANSPSPFDVILLFFNFIQHYALRRDVVRLLKAVSGALTPGGLVVMDWHDEPALLSTFPPGSVTRLNLQHSGGDGATSCAISARRGKATKWLTCQFRVRTGHSKPRTLVTRHRMVMLDHPLIDELLGASDLAVHQHLDAVSQPTSLSARRAWRVVTTSTRDWPVDGLVRSMRARLRRVVPGVHACAVGSNARERRPWTAGSDVDVLLIIPDGSLTRLREILAACRRAARAHGIDHCEFRHGPFKIESSAQLHVIVHSSTTLAQVPLVTKLTWVASGGRLLPPSVALARHRSNAAVIRSAVYNNRRMQNDLRRGRLGYREWHGKTRPTLRWRSEAWTPGNVNQGFARYIVRASLSDLAVCRGLDPYSDDVSEGLPSAAKRLAEGLLQSGTPNRATEAQLKSLLIDVASILKPSRLK